MNRYQRGYTLIELMISLLLGLMLISGFGSLFVQTQKNATVQRSLSYMMDDGRYVLEIFGRELRRAGFLRSKGSLLGNADDVFKDDLNVLGSTMSFSSGDYIKGEYNAAGFGTAYNINRLALRYQLNDKTELAVNEPSTDNSPCTRAIHLTDVAEDSTTAVHENENPAIDVHVVTFYFYVALDNSNVPVLYCKAKRQNYNDSNKNKTSAPEPLISNVQQLLIAYGIDTDADSAANYYVDAGSVTNWQRVVAAKLSVVLQSEDDNLTKSSVSYTIDGTSYKATDKRLYRVFSTTIAFRNQI